MPKVVVAFIFTDYEAGSAEDCTGNNLDPTFDPEPGRIQQVETAAVGAATETRPSTSRTTGCRDIRLCGSDSAPCSGGSGTVKHLI